MHDFTLNGPLYKEAKVWDDSRGFFMEAWKRGEGESWDWKQQNVSFSKAGVVRGLHYRARKPEAKLVRCLSGAIEDVSVCLDCGETRFWLLDRPYMSVLIPPGWAHGFRAKEDSIVSYLVSEVYDHDDALGINPMDRALKDIPWLYRDNLILSEQDKRWPLFHDRPI